MTLPITLSRYIARQFVTAIAGLLDFGAPGPWELFPDQEERALIGMPAHGTPGAPVR